MSLTTALVAITILLIVVIVVLTIKLFQHTKAYKSHEFKLDEVISKSGSEISRINYFLQLQEKLDHSSELRSVLDILLSELSSVVHCDAISYTIFDGVKVVNKISLNIELPRNALEDFSNKGLSEFSHGFDKEMDFAKTQEILVGRTLSNDNTKLFNSYLFVQIFVGDSFSGVLGMASLDRGSFSKETEELARKSLSYATGTIVSVKNLLNKEQNTLSKILAGLSEGVAVVNKDLTVEFTNVVLSELLQTDKLTDVSFYDLAASFSSKFNLEQKVNKVFEDGKETVFEDLNLGEKFVKVVILPILFNNVVQSVAVIIYDLTKEIEFKRLETEFTAMIVHELRSPLTVIRGTTDMLIKNVESMTTDQKVTLLTQMKGSSENMLNLVNDLLDTAKAEVGKLQLNKNYFDINALIDERLVSYLSIANERGISLDSKLDKSIGQLSIDEAKIKQVLNNLLSNSLKFTDSGGLITVTTKRDHGFAEIVVSDTGKGISDESKAKLFSKFMQFKQRNTSDKGTGLGLVITKGIIETHGGRIWVEDNIPNGTKFIFTLPLT